MIVSFSVSNFLSFSSEETFSLVASGRLAATHGDHAVPIPDSKEKVLRTAVLYGANGAGKSNLFKAVRYVRTVALNPRNKGTGTGRLPFRFGDGEGAPSTFDLQFIAGDKLYRFGFKVDDQRILEEWLVQVVGGRERPLYERVTDSDRKVTIESEGLKTAGDKVLALATVGGPQNQSFLATIQATLEASDVGEELRAILAWFKGGLVLLGPDEKLGPLGYSLTMDSDLTKFASAFLKSSSTGVDHLDIAEEEISEDELRRLLPEGIVSAVFANIAASPNGTAVLEMGDNHELVLERKGENHYNRITIQAAHVHNPNRVDRLNLNEESDGTRRLLNLIPALHHLRTESGVFFIDEIDRSLHPILVREFLDFFLKSCAGGKRQIIVTTHESNLLDLDLLRRDEIWFAEKDAAGATRLYSVVDFKVRKDLEIRKHYLQGRFGAVPFLGNLDLLLTESGEAK